MSDVMIGLLAHRDALRRRISELQSNSGHSIDQIAELEFRLRSVLAQIDTYRFTDERVAFAK